MSAPLAIVGVLLAAIVGLASAGAPWANSGSSGGGSLPAVARDVLAVALAVALCAFVVMAWVTMPRSAKRKRRQAAGDSEDDVRAGVRTSVTVLLAGIGFVLLLAAFAVVLARARPSEPLAPVAADAGVRSAPRSSTTGPALTTSPTFHWFAFGLAASIAILVPLGLLARRRVREPEPEALSSDPQERVARAVVDSIGEIERDPDARRSIIRAYAHMEAAFDDTGIPRRPHEAPFEFVGRALGGVQVSPTIAERLATLFERARFSTHPMRAEDKGEALRALRDIQRELEPDQ